VSGSLSITSGAAGRYATALFALGEEDKNLSLLETDMEKISELIQISKAFEHMIMSPVYKRRDQENAVSAISKKMKLSKNTENLLKLMARKRRLQVVPQFIEGVRSLIESERDEMSAEIIAAETLTKSQTSKLEKVLGELLGKKINLEIKIDKLVIGGLVIKLGSRMIDTTIKSKLVKLQNIMKEVN
jgi:F-type H+-transporting ATPase subunit delta